MRRAVIERCAILLFTAVTWPLAVHAQGKKDAKECEKAAKVIDKGHPAHEKRDALKTLLECGKVGATATSAAILDSRTEQDTRVLLDFWNTADGWRDGVVMQAALQVARDGAAATPARVFAIRHLLVLISPGSHYSYGSLTKSMDPPDTITLTCSVGYSNHWRSYMSAPLPTDYLTQLEQAFVQIRESPSTPIAVRNATLCAGT